MTPGMVSAIIANPLDKEQEQMLQQRERDQRRFNIMATPEVHNNYVFTAFSVEERICQTLGLLVVWTIGPTATTPGELEACRV